MQIRWRHVGAQTIPFILSDQYRSVPTFYGISAIYPKPSHRLSTVQALERLSLHIAGVSVSYKSIRKGRLI